jgi:hypothetical protein
MKLSELIFEPPSLTFRHTDNCAQGLATTTLFIQFLYYIRQIGFLARFRRGTLIVWHICHAFHLEA